MSGGERGRTGDPVDRFLIALESRSSASVTVLGTLTSSVTHNLVACRDGNGNCGEERW